MMSQSELYNKYTNFVEPYLPECIFDEWCDAHDAGEQMTLQEFIDMRYTKEELTELMYGDLEKGVKERNVVSKIINSGDAVLTE